MLTDPALEDGLRLVCALRHRVYACRKSIHSCE